MEDSNLLYHYTNAQGLLGMINDRAIWASSYRYLNDAQEFEYGFNLISEIYPPPDLWTIHENDQLPDSSFAEMLKIQKMRYETDCLFVASFTAEDNLLSQWRAYAGPHSGYAIGFQKNILNDCNGHLVKCEYDKGRQKDALKKLIDEKLPILRSKFEKGINEKKKNESPNLTEYYKIVDTTQTEIAKLSTSFKHKSFREEKEWRLVINLSNISADKILYRPSDVGIIPYVKIGFTDNKLPIERIIVGPGPHQKRNEASLRQMLSINGYNNIDISPSDIPYRNW